MDETYHRWPTRRAFREACAAAGWQADEQGRPVPPPGATIDVIGPLVDPPTEVNGLLVDGEADARYHVNAIWHGADMPAEFAAAELVHEAPTRTFSDRDPETKRAKIKARFEAARAANRDDPRLRPARQRP